MLVHVPVPNKPAGDSASTLALCGLLSGPHGARIYSESHWEEQPLSGPRLFSGLRWAGRARTHLRLLLVSVRWPVPALVRFRPCFVALLLCCLLASIQPRPRTPPTMSASGTTTTEGGAALISGTELAKATRAQVQATIAQTRDQAPAFRPHLCIVQVGAQSASSTYIRGKLRAAEECDIKATHVQLPDGASEDAICKQVRLLNQDPSVHGVLVQLPLGEHIDADAERRVTEEVSPAKDVDGFHALNIGHLSSKAANPLFEPCTPKAVIKLLSRAGLDDLAGLTAVVVGRSDIVGNPVSSLLRSKNCTVTQVHSKTTDLPSHLKQADIVVAALGKPNFVQGDWLKPGSVVIDVGINYVEDASKKTGYRLVGDVDFASASRVTKAITPVPGGVGPMTIACLMENVLQGALRLLREGKYNPRGVATPNPIQLIKPVPADIVVARSQTPRPIAQVANEVGILAEELEPYGDKKAKVSLDILERLKHRTNGKYIVVAGITPTPLGEGKSTTTIGLVQALGAHLHKPSFACVRQPSQGPTFGIKGGAAGGGFSQVIPMEEVSRVLLSKRLWLGLLCTWDMMMVMTVLPLCTRIAFVM